MRTHVMDTTSAEQVEALRHFNRFYTREIGVLEEGLLKSRFTLTQARVLFELATRKSSTFSELKDTLGLDRGYLSRILRGFAANRLISRRKSTEDARSVLLSLTWKGQQAFAGLDQRARQDAAVILKHVPTSQRTRLLSS